MTAKEPETDAVAAWLHRIAESEDPPPWPQLATRSSERIVIALARDGKDFMDRPKAGSNDPMVASQRGV